jgi:hypothetical protein
LTRSRDASRNRGSRDLERSRPGIKSRHAILLQADGPIERQSQVQHIMVARLMDLSDVLSGLTHPSRDFH